MQQRADFEEAFRLVKNLPPKARRRLVREARKLDERPNHKGSATSGADSAKLRLKIARRGKKLLEEMRQEGRGLDYHQVVRWIREARDRS